MRKLRFVALALLAASLSGCTQDPANQNAPREPSLAFPRSTCPPALRHIRDVKPADSRDDGLLGTAPPRSALICTYAGVGGPHPSATRALASHTRLGPTAAAALATAVAKVSVARPPDGSAACPADFGATTVVTFAFDSGPLHSLWWQTSGCQTLDNGRVEASQLASPSFEQFQQVFQRSTQR